MARDVKSNFVSHMLRTYNHREGKTNAMDVAEYAALPAIGGRQPTIKNYNLKVVSDTLKGTQYFRMLEINAEMQWCSSTNRYHISNLLVWDSLQRYKKCLAILHKLQIETWIRPI